MLRPSSVLLTLSLLVPLSAAQTLRHVRIESPRAAELADELASQGYDVVEGSLQTRAFEVIGSEEDVATFSARGLEPRLLAIGRPYAEIQREALASAPEAVPSGYSDLAGIVARMNAAAAAYPSIAQVVDVTQAFGAPATHDGRNILAIKISDNVALDEDEPNLLIVGCHHAREIVTPEIALTAMEKLLAGYGIDPTITSAVDGQEIWIAPVWNPDGYVYVFDVDNLWRKNRRENGNGTWGVDTNRNYPFGWTNACSGSSSSGDPTYKGPSAGSEPETQTMMLFSQARRFAKVIDYHSYGREVLWGYDCWTHPFGVGYLQVEAAALAGASGYVSDRPPSADGEHFEWQLANFTNYAFLIETHTQFQPSYASAKAEAVQLWGGLQFVLQRPTPLSGHVLDSVSGQPVSATVKFPGVAWAYGESNASGGPFGRYTAVLPPGNYDVEFSAPCYPTQVVGVNLVAGASLELDVFLTSTSTTSLYCTTKTTSIPGCVPALSFTGTPSATAGFGFDVSAGPTPGGNVGLFLYTTQGPALSPIQTPFGWLCLGPNLVRCAFQSGGGTLGVCDGQYTVDFNTYIATQTIAPDLVAGATVDLQAWYRDPPNVGGANLTGAANFVLCP